MRLRLRVRVRHHPVFVYSAVHLLLPPLLLDVWGGLLPQVSTVNIIVGWSLKHQGAPRGNMLENYDA